MQECYLHTDLSEEQKALFDFFFFLNSRHDRFFLMTHD